MNEPTDRPALTTFLDPQRCGLALGSLTPGIAGIVLCLGPLAGIPGVICGHLAQSKIKNSGGALARLFTGDISIAMIVVIGLLAAIAIPNFVKAREAAQRNACILNLRSLEGAKATWALEMKRKTQTCPRILTCPAQPNA